MQKHRLELENEELRADLHELITLVMAIGAHPDTKIHPGLRQQLDADLKRVLKL